jgi:hypothetical protein
LRSNAQRDTLNATSVTPPCVFPRKMKRPLLDPDQVRRDMLTAFERKSDPYIEGAYEPAPSVMSLNSTVASLSVTMALAVVAGLPVPARHLVYRALASSVRAVATAPREHCVICSADGRLARGDNWPFPGRQD